MQRKAQSADTNPISNGLPNTVAHLFYKGRPGKSPVLTVERKVDNNDFFRVNLYNRNMAVLCYKVHVPLTNICLKYGIIDT